MFNYKFSQLWQEKTIQNLRNYNKLLNSSLALISAFVIGGSRGEWEPVGTMMSFDLGRDLCRS